MREKAHFYTVLFLSSSSFRPRRMSMGFEMGGEGRKRGL